MMRILIGFDGSPASIAAVADLRKAGLPRQAMVRVVTACPAILPLESLAPGGQVPDGYAAAYAQAVANHKANEAHALGQAKAGTRLVKSAFPGWKVEARMEPDSPAHALLDMAAAWKADLLVLGSRGWNEFGKLLFGSVADKVMNHAPCPVRLGRPGSAGKGAPHVLIAYDGSPFADAAVALVAGRTWPKGTKATVLAVSEIQLRFGEITAAITRDLGFGDASGPWPWMERRLAKVAKRLADAGLRAETSLVIGEIRHSLLRNAKLLKVDAIFMGSHGRTGLRRVMLGSVAAAVAAHAPCTVEVIHAKPKRTVK